MAYDRFLISPINNGLQTDLKPYAIPEDAFAHMYNAYTFRGRVRKRFGARSMNVNVDPELYQQHSRLRIAIPIAAAPPLHGQTDINGDAAGFAPNGVAPGISSTSVPVMFSIGDDYFTPTDFTAGMHNMLSTNLLAIGKFDATTGQYSFVGATPLTQIYFYLGRPVMGFVEYQQGQVNDNVVIAFDTRYSYSYTAGAWDRLDTTRWTGTDLQFFQGSTWTDATSYANILFVTNFNQPDQIKYWNGVVWASMNPIIRGADTLETARLLIVFKDRLIALNTIEHVAGSYRNYFNRARFCQNGSPLAVDSWRENIPGKGGWIDCPVKEAIITAQILKDRLIVYFEDSTWELVYTGNEILPFRWQQINTELGAISTFSAITFDKVLLGVDNVGLHACNGANVERIDEKIPDQVFDINQYDGGPARVAGIRDFKTEMVYWSYPSNVAFGDLAPKFPNKILVYNYRLGTWAINDDSITAFGYYDLQDSTTWQSTELWSDVTDMWGSGDLGNHPRQIVAGNQQGFTFLVDIENSRNACSLQITNIDITTGIITVYSHNFQEGDYILIESCIGTTEINDTIYSVKPLSANTLYLVDANGADITSFADAYAGGGTVALVSLINIKTKQFNFYLKEGRNAYIAKVDFLVQHDPGGELTIECYPSYGNLKLVNSAIYDTQCNLGTSVLELTNYASVPTELFQELFWHPVYFQAEGESVQFELSLTDAQIRNYQSALSDFQLNAFIVYTMPTGARLQ